MGPEKSGCGRPIERAFSRRFAALGSNPYTYDMGCVAGVGYLALEIEDLNATG